MKALLRLNTNALLRCGILILSSIQLQAAPTPFGANHYSYVEVPNPFPGNSWQAARDAAASSTYGGIHGHLATISSQAENDFLQGLAGAHAGFTGAWLGGASAGWLVGPEAGQGFGSFSNWGGVEPNNSGYAYMNIGSSFAGIASGHWADDSGVQGVPEADRDPVVGYFIEYEGVSHVPDSAPGWILVANFAGLIAATGIARHRKP